jgi:hypothetical protein
MHPCNIFFVLAFTVIGTLVHKSSYIGLNFVFDPKHRHIQNVNCVVLHMLSIGIVLSCMVQSAGIQIFRTGAI